MNIYDILREDIKKSMKQKNGETTVLRGIDSAIQLKAKNLRVDITDDIVLDIITKGIKQRNDSIEAFVKGGRLDLVEKETIEIVIIERYLPEQLSNEEIELLIHAAIAESGATAMKDMGKVMGLVTKQSKGKADNGKISAIVRDLLGKK